MKIKKPLGNEIYSLIDARTEIENIILGKKFLQDCMCNSMQTNHKATLVVVAALQHRWLAGQLLGEARLDTWDEMLSVMVTRFERLAQESNDTNKKMSRIVLESTESIEQQYEDSNRDEDEEDEEVAF
jgi:hypothetical protein